MWAFKAVVFTGDKMHGGPYAINKRIADNNKERQKVLYCHGANLVDVRIMGH